MEILHVHRNSSHSFPLNGYIIFLCMAATNVFNHFHIHEYLLYFQCFALTNNAAANMHEHISLKTVLFISVG